MFKYKTVVKKREFNGFTQEKLASLSGIRKEQISRLENGKIANPTLLTLEKLASALHCKVSDLIDESIPIV